MMKAFSKKSQDRVEYPGCYAWPFFEEGESPCKGYRAMYNHFYNEEYIVPYGVHEDHEGFFVVSGTGTMMIGDEEFVLEPGVSMVAPANVPHAIRKTSEQDLEIFLYHFPVI